MSNAFLFSKSRKVNRSTDGNVLMRCLDVEQQLTVSLFPPWSPSPVSRPVAGPHPLHPASFLGKAAANDPNAAWAAYYAQYYHQPPGGGPAQNPATPAGGGAQPSGEQTQPAQTPGGQPDYSKAWEEYYKQMGEAAEQLPLELYLLFYCC